MNAPSVAFGDICPVGDGGEGRASGVAIPCRVRNSLSSSFTHFFEFDPQTLTEWCGQRGMPAFRAKQLLEWVYAKGTIDPEKMTNLSKRDREMLAAEMVFISGETVAEHKASDGTRKLLIEWWEGGRKAGGQGGEGAREQGGEGGREQTPSVSLRSTAPPSAPPAGERAFRLNVVDGKGDSSRQTECVMIPADEVPNAVRRRGQEEDEPVFRRRTACISSQVGCPVGCKFCASGLGGLDGNLSAGRIVEQVWRLGQLPGVGRITNVVFMGMGEPLANFANVTRAIRTICGLWGLGISARKVTISTVGLPKAIERLAEELELPVTLALSLHAPNDELRRQLIPWAEYTSIDELLRACGKWFDKTGREITLEYIMLRGVNDRPQHAKQLAEVARTLRANVNLIRYNEVKGIEFLRPRDEDVRSFQEVLRKAFVNVHIRASRGRDIAAACGQLRHEKSR
jgi:23S rRNA (adenine2503-C2)-methyltransferase